jgi:hypothetical protein
MTKIVKFSIPYIDQPISFWEEIKAKFGASFKEVYFPLSHYSIGTARPIQPDKYLYDFLESKILPASVIFPIEISDGFYKTTLECDKNCLTCDFCRNYYNQHY